MEQYINALFNNIILKKSLIVKDFDVFLAKTTLNVWLVAFVPLLLNSPETAQLKDLNWFHVEYRVHIEKIFGASSGIKYHTFPVQKLNIPDGFPLIDFQTVERNQDGIKYKNINFPNFEIFLFNDPKNNANIQHPKFINLVRAVLTNWFSCTVLNKSITSSNIVVL
jgi:hypothetical protein